MGRGEFTLLFRFFLSKSLSFSSFLSFVVYNLYNPPHLLKELRKNISKNLGFFNQYALPLAFFLRKAGFRESGLSLGRKRVMVQLRTLDRAAQPGKLWEKSMGRKLPGFFVFFFFFSGQRLTPPYFWCVFLIVALFLKLKRNIFFKVFCCGFS